MKTPFTSPTRITSLYGPRKAPVPGASTQHKGIDFVISDKVVRASEGGTIRSVNLDANKDSAGRYVTIKHIDGKITKYFHLDSTTCKVGQLVKEGEQIGIMGNTGIGSGPHLHFELWVNDNHVDPSSYLGIVNKVGTVTEMPKPIPKWETILRSKLTSADEWVDKINERISYGVSTNTIEKNFATLIEKLSENK
jgi:murein DD-endopeptidase MepM/ murein hydrolase activator NlpD